MIRPSVLKSNGPGRVQSWGFAALILAIAAGPALADPMRLTIHGNGTELGETPLVAELKGTHGPGVYHYRLRTGADDPGIPAIVYVDAGKIYLVTVLNHVPAGDGLSFSAETEYPAKTKGKGIEFRPDGPNLDVFDDGKLVTVDRTDDPSKPIFYPLFGPNGAAFTRAFPMKKDVPGEDQDHNHHRSFWFTHGDVNGYDFWASDPLNKPKPNDGSIRESSREILAAGAGVGILKTTDDWLAPDGKRVCEDERLVRFYQSKSARFIDFEVTIKATAGPVVFGDTKEGMFGLRLASSMDVMKGKARGAGRIINAEGITDDAAWGKASPWVDYTGPIDGKEVGVAILNHPESFRYPTTWHVRTYGLFAANPFGYHDFKIDKPARHEIPVGGQIQFRYRIILHEGNTAAAHIADAFKAYANPPTATLQRE